MLFLYMTMKAWQNYTITKLEKIRAAKENGIDYVDSESDKDDYISDSGSLSSSSSEDENPENVEENEDGLAEIDEENLDEEEIGEALVYAASRQQLDNDKISE